DPHGAALTPVGDPPAPRVFVLGAGRAGLGVSHAVAAAGGTLPGIHGRRPLPADAPLPSVTAGALPARLGGATVVLVAVQDRALDVALAQVADAVRAGALADGGAVLQASGSAEPGGFAALRALGVACGTFHPLVPLAEWRQAPGLLRGAWVGVDGDAGAQPAARALAPLPGAHALGIPAGQKARYHAAAVFASNFPIVLAAIAERLLARAGVDADEARPAVRHLLSSAAANLARGDDAALALTGPVVRGDDTTVRRHLGAIADDPGADAAYRALAREAVTLARAAGTPAEALREVEALLLEILLES
ncbi:DUF2520 domain-containing protein, partial [Roseisolibacter sp. H3M3-2]|uniref:DUF2520 domain-containing protein n=1 Tax=Roseisolibacter sp. H3M3-2 TaxID=3031323 RepID=UPI0023D99160